MTRIVTKIRLCFFLLTLSILSAALAYAERKIFTFSSDYTEAILAEGREYTVLRGNARVTADDVQINAREIILYGDNFQFAEVLGSFEALDLKNDFSLSGDNLFYDRTEKLLRAEGNILMQDNQNDIIIRAHFLESKNDGDFMVVQLGVRITQGNELSARTEFLTYYRKTEILEMTGFPYALWKKDEYRADRVSINLNTDEVVLEGKVRGFISTTQNKEEENNGNTEETNKEGDREEAVPKENSEPNSEANSETNIKNSEDQE